MKILYLAWNSIYAKKKWFFALFGLFFITSILMFTAFHASNRVQKYFAEAEKAMPMDVMVELRGGQVNQVPGVPCLPAEKADKMAVLPQVKAAYYTCWTQAFGKNIEPARKELFTIPEDFLSDFFIIGTSDSYRYSQIEDGSIALAEGRFARDGVPGEAVISQALAETNGIKLGDSISLEGVRQPSAVESLEVVGIHSGEFGFIYPVWADAVNQIFVSLDTALLLQGVSNYREAIYTLESAARTEDFISAASEIIAGNEDLDIVPMELNYGILHSTGEDVQFFVMIVLITIASFGSIIIGLLFIDYINKNRKTIGILSALGAGKGGTLSNYMLQCLFPLGAGILCSFLVFSLVVYVINLRASASGLFWKYTEDIFLLPDQIFWVLGIHVAVLTVFGTITFARIYKTQSWELLQGDMNN